MYFFNWTQKFAFQCHFGSTDVSITFEIVEGKKYLNQLQWDCVEYWKKKLSTFVQRPGRNDKTN